MLWSNPLFDASLLIGTSSSSSLLSSPGIHFFFFPFSFTGFGFSSVTTGIGGLGSGSLKRPNVLLVGTFLASCGGFGIGFFLTMGGGTAKGEGGACVGAMNGKFIRVCAAELMVSSWTSLLLRSLDSWVAGLLGWKDVGMSSAICWDSRSSSSLWRGSVISPSKMR